MARNMKHVTMETLSDFEKCHEMVILDEDNKTSNPSKSEQISLNRYDIECMEGVVNSGN